MTEFHVRPLYDAAAIAGRNEELARDISTTVGGDLLVVAVLRGSFVFAADLIRALHHAGLSPQIEFLQLASYRELTVSSGQVEIMRDIDSNPRGREVLLIDDILESGRTLAFAKDLLVARGAKQVYTCVLLEKPGKRAVRIEPDFVGFHCPDRFLVGYGMDISHSYRELPFIGMVEEIGKPEAG